MTDPTGEPRQPRPRVTLPLGSLPSLPAPLAQLLQLANNPTASPDDLREAVEKVPDFAARLLRALAVMGPDARSVDQALREIGTRGVRGVVSALALAPLFDQNHGRSVDPARVAAHGLACALWSAEVALAVGHQPSTHLLTAALMHDVGMVLLDRVAPDDYASTLEHARRDALHHADLEQQDLGMTHPRAGALLCAKWMLPPRITQLVAGHHLPDAGNSTDGALLAVADHLASSHGAAIFDDSPPRPLTPELLARLGLDADALDALGALAPTIAAQAQAIHAAMRDASGPT